MSNEIQEAPAAGLFQEIRTNPLERRYVYKSPALLTYGFTVVAGLNCLSIVGLILALFGQSGLLARIGQRAFVSQSAMLDAARASDALVALVSLFFLLTLFLSYVFGAFWVYRTAANARGLGARGLEISPGWSVGWYAVPFAALVRPYQAMVQVYQASVSPTRWRLVHAPPVFPIWWGAWILCGLMGSVVSLMGADRALPSLILKTEVQIADAGVDLAAACLFLAIVWLTHRAQIAARASLTDVASVFA